VRAWYNSGRVTVANIDVALQPGAYYVVFDNQFSLVSNKVVSVELRAYSLNNAYPQDRQQTAPEIFQQSENGRSQAASPCSGHTTADLNECAKITFRNADAELNSVYRILLSKITDRVTKEKLIKAQRTWIAFRDESCQVVRSLNAGGTIETMRYIGCLTMTTENRTNELHIILKESFEN
jgi:uncharacterized protein YecT (DUF1311 family)